jgi:hypothetical protein
MGNIPIENPSGELPLPKPKKSRVPPSGRTSRRVPTQPNRGVGFGDPPAPPRPTPQPSPPPDIVPSPIRPSPTIGDPNRPGSGDEIGINPSGHLRPLIPRPKKPTAGEIPAPEDVPDPDPVQPDPVDPDPVDPDPVDPDPVDPDPVDPVTPDPVAPGPDPPPGAAKENTSFFKIVPIVATQVFKGNRNKEDFESKNETNIDNLVIGQMKRDLIESNKLESKVFQEEKERADRAKHKRTKLRNKNRRIVTQTEILHKRNANVDLVNSRSASDPITRLRSSAIPIPKERFKYNMKGLAFYDKATVVDYSSPRKTKFTNKYYSVFQ